MEESEHYAHKRKEYVKDTQKKIKEYKKGKDVVKRSALAKALKSKSE